MTKSTSLLFVLALVSFGSFGCAGLGLRSVHNDSYAEDPTGVARMDCTRSFASENCTQYRKSTIPGGATFGGYGMAGVGVGMPYPMVPYQTITPGMAAIVNQPAGVAIVPNAAPAVTQPNGSFATKADVRAVGKATVQNSKDICELKRKQGQPCN